MLGTVPESKAIMASNEGAAAAELPFMENEAFRMLRASLRYFNVDHDVRSVLVTSHAAGVGKSTVAWNLARVAASSSKAVIVETDLRNPTLSRQHGLKAGPGLAELLTHQVGLDEAIQAKPIVAAGSNGAEGGGRALDVIVAGSLPPNPAELIESQTMSEALTQLAEHYELVVIDTAPVGVVSDAIPLLRKVDGVIVVARMDKSTRDGAEQTREQLGRLEAPVLRHRRQRHQGATRRKVWLRLLRRLLPAGGGADERRGGGQLGHRRAVVAARHQTALRPLALSAVVSTRTHRHREHSVSPH